jgi:glycosyltransferase involved in cell wall biosynthesis
MQNAKVSLAPLRFGAGLKGKLIDAMQNGTPCVMSLIAAEGMFGDFQSNGFIENKPEAFAQKAIALYINADVWQNKQKNGFKVLNERFNKTHFQREFACKIEDLRKNLKTHRQQNFIGNLLQHQTLQSTKYLSKWIEEKNR